MPRVRLLDLDEARAAADRVEHDLSDEQWAALRKAWGGCASCGAVGRPLQRDCVLALSRGGRYTLTNIVPACASCNASKCNQEVTTWLRRKGLDERAFLASHIRVLASLDAYRGGSGAGTPADPLPLDPAG